MLLCCSADCREWLSEYSTHTSPGSGSEHQALSLKSYKRVFDAFDADGDQELSLPEFKKLCGALKAAAAEDAAAAGQEPNLFESFLRALGSRAR